MSAFCLCKVWPYNLEISVRFQQQTDFVALSLPGVRPNWNYTQVHVFFTPWPITDHVWSQRTVTGTARTNVFKHLYLMLLPVLVLIATGPVTRLWSICGGSCVDTKKNIVFSVLWLYSPTWFGLNQNCASFINGCRRIKEKLLPFLFCLKGYIKRSLNSGGNKVIKQVGSLFSLLAYFVVQHLSSFNINLF